MSKFVVYRHEYGNLSGFNVPKKKEIVCFYTQQDAETEAERLRFRTRKRHFVEPILTNGAGVGLALPEQPKVFKKAA